MQKKGWLGVNSYPDTLTEKEFKQAFYAKGNKSRELMPKVYKTENGDYKDEVYISRGIDDSGALLVEGKDGNVFRVTSGEVSVRGLYGYV